MEVEIQEHFFSENEHTIFDVSMDFDDYTFLLLLVN